MNNGTDQVFFVGHSDWDLLNITMDRVDSYPDVDQHVPFVEMIVRITLERRTKFFYYMYLVPANLVLFLLPIVHLLPPNKDSKTVICK